jgi:hypothetical protein
VNKGGHLEKEYLSQIYRSKFFIHVEAPKEYMWALAYLTLVSDQSSVSGIKAMRT